MVTELGLAFAGFSCVLLADGSDAALDAYAVTVLWDGRPRRVVAYASDATPLVGMSLLVGHSLCVDVEHAGRVIIEPKA